MNAREFYAKQSPMSDPGRFAAELAALPADFASLAAIAEGLVLHPFVAGPFYGVELGEERLADSHLRPVRAVLARIKSLDGRPLSEARPPERRIAGACNVYALLMVSVLRAHGVPARCRWGFAGYLNDGYWEDHVVPEAWDASGARWRLMEPQLDAVWREKLSPDFDTLDVPRERFLDSAAAWIACREGRADPRRFGIMEDRLRGLWFVAHSLVKAAAALNGDEMLPWDAWGDSPKGPQELGPAQLARFDALARLLRDPDANFDALRAAYREDEGLRVPPVVFNAMRQRAEQVAYE